MPEVSFLNWESAGSADGAFRRFQPLRLWAKNDETLTGNLSQKKAASVKKTYGKNLHWYQPTSSASPMAATCLEVDAIHQLL